MDMHRHGNSINRWWSWGETDTVEWNVSATLRGVWGGLCYMFIFKVCCQLWLQTDYSRQLTQDKSNYKSGLKGTSTSPCFLKTIMVEGLFLSVTTDTHGLWKVLSLWGCGCEVSGAVLPGWVGTLRCCCVCNYFVPFLCCRTGTCWKPA